MAFGGTWNSADPPQRSGVFINVESAATPRDVVDALGVVAIMVQADWGPLNTVQEVRSEAEAEFYYGTTGTALFCCRSAVIGEDIPGRSGARLVLAYRAATGSAAKAAKTLQNTTPASALTLTAKYQGARGNNFKVTVQTNAIDGAKKDILIHEGTTLRESFTSLTSTDIAGMVTTINATSNLVVASLVLDGVALGNIAASSFTGGSSGSALTSTEHVAAMAAFESYGGFSVATVDNLTDDTIRLTWRDWTDRLNGEGKLHHLIVGGAASESASNALDRSTALDSPYVVNTFGDVTIDGVAYNSAKMTSRVAGILAGAGIARSTTFAQLNGAVMATPPSMATIEALVRGMVIPFWADGATVRMQRARTTLKTVSSAEPVQMKSLLWVRKLQETLRQLDAVGTSVIGNAGFVNTDSGRKSLVGAFQAKVDDLIGRNIALPGGKVYLDPAKDNTGESLYMIYSINMAPGIEQILGRITLSS